MSKYKKNKQGYYRTAVTVGRAGSGKAKRKWLSAKTIPELDRKKAETKKALSQGLNPISFDIRFGTYAEMWLETYKSVKGINTRKMYRQTLKHLASLDHMRVMDIRPMHVQQVINEKSSMPKTCRNIRATLRQIFKQAIADGIIAKNPADSIELPRYVSKERRALTKEEKAAIKAAPFNAQERALVMIAYGCGLRPGEIYALTWQDIDFKNNLIHVDKSIVFDGNRPVLSLPKTNRSIRSVYMPGIVSETLKAYRSVNITPRLFADPNGEYNTGAGYDYMWRVIKKKIEDELGYKTDMTLYYFRHNYCTELYYSGVSLKEAQRLLGHSSHAMIMNVYAHLDAERENTNAKLEAIDF